MLQWDTKGFEPAWEQHPLSLEASLRGSTYPVHVVQKLLAWQVVTITQRKPTSGSRTRMNRIQRTCVAIGGATVRWTSQNRCSHAFIDSQTHVPSRGLNLWWILRWDTETFEPEWEQSLIFKGPWHQPLDHSCIYDWYRIVFHYMWWKTMRYQSYIHEWPSG